MCGRYTLTMLSDIVRSFYGVDHVDEDLTPRYNIAPTQRAPIVREDVDGDGWRLDLVRWSFTPSWWAQKRIGPINARSETVAGKKMFLSSLRRRRCLVPANGFYEWAPAPKKGGKKQPYRFVSENRIPFAFAGLWTRGAIAPDQPPIDSFLILTTEAQSPVAEIHNRMPVILPRSAWEVWLDSSIDNEEPLDYALHAVRQTKLEAYPVSTDVNSSRNEGKELVASVELP